MPDNVLSGKIVVTAPGVDATFNKVAAATVKTAAALKQLPATTSAATQSLINLSRVAQDAPYGFIGIANNINPLLESFQRLRASTTSTGGALKALAGEMLGAGGLGLAVGVVSSLLVVFSSRSHQAAKATEQLNTAADEAKKKQEEFQSAINSAAGALVKEAKNLNDLKSILEATSGAMATLTSETIKRGVAGFIFSQKESELQKVLSAEIEKQFLLKKRLANLNTPFAGTREFKVDEPVLRQLKAQQQANREFGRADVELDKVIKRIEELNDVIGSSTGSIELLNAMSSGFEKLFKNFVSGPIKIPEIQLAPSKIKLGHFGINAFDFEQTALSNIKIPKPKIKFDQTAGGLAGTEVGDLSAAEKALIKAADDLSETFQRAFQSGLADSFAALGEGIGNLLSGKDFGTQIFQVLGSLLEEIGKALIKFGIVQVGIKKILENPLIPGGVAIGLGISAIAIGSLLKNIKSAGGGRAAGGGVSAGQGVWVGERGKEFFRPNTGGTIEAVNSSSVGGFMQPMQLSGRVENILRGKDLVQVITLQTQSNRRLT